MSPNAWWKMVLVLGLLRPVASDRLTALLQRGWGNSLKHPERHDPEGRSIPLALDVADGRRDHLEIFGDDYPMSDGTCIRDYVHVSDLAEAHVLAITALETRAELVLNLGSGVGYSNRQVVETVKKVTGAGIRSPLHRST